MFSIGGLLTRPIYWQSMRGCASNSSKISYQLQKSIREVITKVLKSSDSFSIERNFQPCEPTFDDPDLPLRLSSAVPNLIGRCPDGSVVPREKWEDHLYIQLEEPASQQKSFLTGNLFTQPQIDIKKEK